MTTEERIRLLLTERVNWLATLFFFGCSRYTKKICPKKRKHGDESDDRYGRT